MITRLRRRLAWWLLSFDKHHAPVFIPFTSIPEWASQPHPPTLTTAATGRAIYVHSGQKVPCA